MKCEVCGKTKYNEKRKEYDLRPCCDHPDSQLTCEACYIQGKGTHPIHSMEPRKK